MEDSGNKSTVCKCKVIVQGFLEDYRAEICSVVTEEKKMVTLRENKEEMSDSESEKRPGVINSKWRRKHLKHLQALH